MKNEVFLPIRTRCRRVNSERDGDNLRLHTDIIAVEGASSAMFDGWISGGNADSAALAVFAPVYLPEMSTRRWRLARPAQMRRNSLQRGINQTRRRYSLKIRRRLHVLTPLTGFGKSLDMRSPVQLSSARAERTPVSLHSICSANPRLRKFSISHEIGNIFKNCSSLLYLCEYLLTQSLYGRVTIPLCGNISQYHNEKYYNETRRISPL